MNQHRTWINNPGQKDPPRHRAIVWPFATTEGGGGNAAHASSGAVSQRLGEIGGPEYLHAVSCKHLHPCTSFSTILS
jgi:hypothetical protein